jgi:Transglycosylase
MATRTVEIPPLPAAPRHLVWGVGLGLAVAAPSIGYALLAQQVVRLEDALSARTGLTCRIASLEAGFTGNLRVRHLEIGTLLAADAIEASISWASLLSSPLHVDEVRIESPKMQISVSATGDSDLEQVASRWARADNRTPHAGDSARPAPPRRIVVSEGELTLTVAGLGSLRAQDVELVPQHDGVRAIARRISLEASGSPLRCIQGQPEPRCGQGRAALHIDLAQAAADLTLPQMRLQRLVAVGGSGQVQLASSKLALTSVSLARLHPGDAFTAQLTLDDRGVPRPFELSAVASPTPALRLRAERLPLWPIAAMIPSWIGTDQAQFRGDVAIALGSNLGIAVDGTLEGARLGHPALASGPVDLAMDLDGVATLERRPDAPADGALSASIAGIHASGNGRIGSALWSGSAIAHRGSSLSAILDVAVRPAPCADLLASIPRGLRGALDGMAMAGQFGGRLRVEIDTAQPLGEGAQLRIEGDGSGCAVTAEPAAADVTTLLSPREHKFPDGSRAAIGPGVGSWVELRQLPAHVNGAFVAAEDARFFDHRGFDVVQIARSLEIDVREGRLARGGSTISQQLIKNAFLDGKRSLARKLSEAILTWRLEARLSKRDILEGYLNVIELGPSVYGLAAATQHWFGSAPRDLTVRQAAFLAALTPEPTTMTRRIVAAGGLDRTSAARVDTVLRAMKRQGVIPQHAYELARRADLDFRSAALTARE